MFPVAIAGAADVLAPRGRLLLHPGTVHVHLLDPVPTGGLSAVNRVEVAAQARAAVLGALEATQASTA